MNALLQHADFIEGVRLPELRKDVEQFVANWGGEPSNNAPPPALERLTRAIAEYEAIVDDIRCGRPV
jgi:hypothetical protein